MIATIELLGNGEPPAPRRIGPYRLMNLLGEGGVGFVHRAVHEQTGQVAAVKYAKLRRERHLASLRRELESLRRLDHRGIVRILDGGVFEGMPWYAMELLEGQTLANFVQWGVGPLVSATTTTLQGEPTPTSLPTDGTGPAAFAWPAAGDLRPPACGGRLLEFLTIVRRLCDPLAHIHGDGLVHRDLKPSNIFIRTDGTPVLMDFGLVWLLTEEGGRERLIDAAAARAGTIAYMAPEQALGRRLDARADMFSLGCVMFEAITGRLPFPDRFPRDLGNPHAHQPPPPPSELADGVPPELDEVVLKLLAPRPRDRIGHATDLAAALARLGAADWPAARPGAPRPYLFRPDLAGRTAMFDTAASHVDRLESGKGGLLMLSGESGIGKTSFAGELALRARARGRATTVVTGECAAVGMTQGRGLRRGEALYPFDRLLQFVADRCVEEGTRATERLLGDGLGALASCFPALRDLPGARQQPDAPELPSDASKRRLIQALKTTVLALTTERPLLLILEDLQWADDLTFDFISTLEASVFESHRLLLVTTYRSEEMGAELRQLAALPHAVNLRLDWLDDQAIATMAAEMLGQTEVPPALSTFLAAESSGNPFFAGEYLRAALDGGLLQRDEAGRWRLEEIAGSIATLGLPSSLRALVERRLDSLERTPRRLAELAAVLGREFETDVLQAFALTLGDVGDEAGLANGLRELTIRQVLERVGPAGFRFAHDKLRETAYEAIEGDRRRELHRRAGLLLEQHHRDRASLERHYAQLAHHFEQAGDTRRAIEYLDLAGAEAHRTHSNQEALRTLSRAQSLETSSGLARAAIDRARRARLLGLNALAVGDVQGALKSLLDATEISGHPWPGSRPKIVARTLTSLVRETGRRLLPKAANRRAGKSEEREILLEAARAYERLTVVFYFATGDFASVALAALANVDLAERAGGPSAERALGYAALSAMCGLIPLDRPARAYGDLAIQTARGVGDPAVESWVLVNLTQNHIMACRWREAEECAQQVRSIASGIAFMRRWEEATTQLSSAFLLAGRFSEAESLNQDLGHSVQRGDPQARAWHVVRSAELALVAGDTATALACAREGERLCNQGLLRAEWIYALGPLALAALRSGDRKEAEEVADRCAEWIAKGSPIAFYNIFSYSAVAEVYFELLAAEDRAEQRSTLLRKAQAAVKQMRAIGRVMRAAAPRALLWRGREAQFQQQPAKAASFFGKALTEARSLKLPFEEALALTSLGELAPGDDSQRRASLEQASLIFERLGALREAGRLEKLLSGAGPGRF